MSSSSRSPLRSDLRHLSQRKQKSIYRGDPDAYISCPFEQHMKYCVEPEDLEEIDPTKTMVVRVDEGGYTVERPLKVEEDKEKLKKEGWDSNIIVLDDDVVFLPRDLTDEAKEKARKRLMRPTDGKLFEECPGLIGRMEVLNLKNSGDRDLQFYVDCANDAAEFAGSNMELVDVVRANMCESICDHFFITLRAEDKDAKKLVTVQTEVIYVGSPFCLFKVHSFRPKT